MRYNQQLNYQRRKQFLFRVRIFFLLLSIPILGAAGYAYYSVISRQNSNTAASSTSQETSGYFAPSVKLFRSTYFQFQTDNTWAEVPAESTANKFVYRSLRANLVEHDLTIYVNEIPATLSANRVLPVNLKSGSELLPITTSEHCKKVSGNPAVHELQTTVNNVSMLCAADSTNYTVLVGQTGGSTVINLQRPDKTMAKYSILYTNLRATPDATQLMQIADSFQAR